MALRCRDFSRCNSIDEIIAALTAIPRQKGNPQIGRHGSSKQKMKPQRHIVLALCFKTNELTRVIPFSPHDFGTYRVSDPATLNKPKNGYPHTPVSQLIVADLDIIQAYNYAGRIPQEGALF